MYKIGVIGDRESVQGFAALGLTTFAVSNPEEANAVLKSPEALEYAVLYITEQLAAQCEQAIELHRQNRTPAVILIPGKDGSLGIGLSNVGKRVEKAVGSNILGD
ncbi:MAG: V-type ATP synthase subunit F [Clostridia bacterium]|jgi:V/A-type H+-transporting ATPase subunit F|nr:V-type ATP synthase subunit F [Clostridia bacterium]MBQ6000239.1 V-type ATP synthase subunit F [Clostridia bacterium]